jgi:excisionase family DNA binding protein
MSDPTDRPDRDLIDSEAVAELIGSPRRHVHNLVASRAIPHYKIGGRLRFDRAEILAWIEASRREVMT